MTANSYDRTAKNVAAGLFGQYNLEPLADWWARQRAIDEMMALDDHTLEDILRRVLRNSRDRGQQRGLRRTANDNQAGTVKRRGTKIGGASR